MTPAFPLIGFGQGNIEDGITSLLVPPSHPASTKQQTTPDIFGKATDAVTGALGQAYKSAISSSFLGLLFGSDYQYLTGIIGLLLIAAGIFLFKPVRETVIEVSKTAAKGAALAA